MNTNTGKISYKSPEENERILRELDRALKDPGSPIPEEIPLTEEEAEKVKGMSRKDRRVWAKKIYRMLKKKKRAELNKELGLGHEGHN